MTDQEIIKACAELDGFHLKITQHQGANCYHWHQFEGTPLHRWIVFHELPPYLTSRDAIIAVIEKLDEETFNRFTEEAYNLFSEDCKNILLLKARQLCEALLRATGKWKE